MNDRVRAPIRLNEHHLNTLAFTTDNGFRDFQAGYALVHYWIKEHPAARADGTVFWLEQARGINNDDSLSASFIRRHTQNGLDLGKVPMSRRLSMQELSDRIAQKVIGDLLRSGEIPPLAKILDKDIRVALNDGGVPLGGWGGSFYYYDMPFNPDEEDLPKRPGLTMEPGDSFYRRPDGSHHTVGDEIDARGDRELLLRTSSKTIKDMVLAGEIRLSDAPQMLQTSWNAGMPATMKSEVMLRAGMMVAEHVRDNVDATLRQIPDDLQHLLQQQRRNLLDRPGKALDELLDGSLPSIPRISAQHAGADASTWQQLATQLDSALDRERALAHGQDAFEVPALQPSAAQLASVPWQQAAHEEHDAQAQREHAPLNDRWLNSVFAALSAGDSDELDRIAITFSQSPEGQRMAQMGDALLAQQQALEQQQLLDHQQAQGAVMRM